MGFYYKSTSLEDRISIIEEIHEFYPVAVTTYHNRNDNTSYTYYPFLSVREYWGDIGGLGEYHSDITNGTRVNRQEFINMLRSGVNSMKKGFNVHVKHYFR